MRDLAFGAARGGRVSIVLAAVACLVGLAPGTATANSPNRAERHSATSNAGTRRTAEPVNFGPKVIVFDPSMPQATIQSQLDSISTQQVPNQFGTQRYAVLFKPGTYGSSAHPLIFQVGYYTDVAGLGAQPGDVVINGAIDVFNQCSGSGPCDALDNFWRSVSNLTINVTLPKSPPAYAPATQESASCNNSAEMWAVSQAAPMRRVIINGFTTLQDYCNRGFASGGFFADDEFNHSVVVNGGQQQFFTRNSNVDNWTNSVWNQVFLGDNGAPATSFNGNQQYTTLPTAPVSQEKPFLYSDSQGTYSVFVPSLRRNSVGPSYASGPAAGRSIPIERFFIATPDSSVAAINRALERGQDLIFTPGVYSLRETIRVTHPNTVVLGLGFPTLIPQDGNVSMQTANVPGIKVGGIIFDAGPQSSPALLELGSCEGGPNAKRDQGLARGGRSLAACERAGGTHDASDPTLAQDVFFRIGGAEAGRAANSLIVNADNAILDDVWAWRADHGAGAGWTSNTADTGVIVNGDNVKAYGLAVEHYQKYEVIWNGQHGEDVFFQNEMPYDPPSQSAWMASPTQDGYPSFLVSPNVRSFQGYGMGSYAFFNQGVQVFSDEAFQSPTTPGVQFHDILTVFLSGTNGGIRSVINGVGGSATAANPGKPVDVTSYP
jgi:hypothetical protein